MRWQLAAGIACLAASCVDPSPAPTGTARDAVIYGDDSRRDVYAVDDPAIAQIAVASTVAFMSAEHLVPVGGGTPTPRSSSVTGTATAATRSVTTTLPTARSTSPTPSALPEPPPMRGTPASSRYQRQDPDRQLGRPLNRRRYRRTRAQAEQAAQVREGPHEGRARALGSLAAPSREPDVTLAAVLDNVDGVASTCTDRVGSRSWAEAAVV